MKFKYSVIIPIALAIILVLIITLSLVPTEKNNKIKIGYLPMVGSHLMFIAQSEVYFSNQDIEPEFVKMQSSNQLIEALLRGDIDLAVEISAIPVIKVSETNTDDIKVFLISKIFIEDEFDAIIVDKNSPINKLKDLEGRKIATFPGSTAPALLKHFLESKNIDISKIVFMPMPPSNHLQALSKGSVDAVHSYEPITSYALVNEIGKKIYGSVYSEQINPSPQGVAVISQKFVEDTPDLTRRLLNVFSTSAKFLDDNNNLSRNILQQELNLDVEVAREIKFYDRSLDEESISSFKRYVDLLNKLGETSLTSTDVSKIVLNISELK